MPNSYTQGSFKYPLSSEDDVKIAEDVIEKIKASFDEESSLDLNIEIKGKGEHLGVYVNGLEYFNPDQAIKLIQNLQEAFKDEEPFTFAWAYSTDRAIVDGFGGGAAAVCRGMDPICIDALTEVQNLLK